MKTKLWNLAVAWAEQEEEYPATLILGYSLRYLFLWAACED